MPEQQIHEIQKLPQGVLHNSSGELPVNIILETDQPEGEAAKSVLRTMHLASNGGYINFIYLQPLQESCSLPFHHLSGAGVLSMKTYEAGDKLPDEYKKALIDLLAFQADSEFAGGQRVEENMKYATRPEEAYRLAKKVME